MATSPTKGVKYISDNRKARHDYFIHETYEAGIALTGTEVKSLRQGKVNLKDSFCRIENGEVLLLGMHISPYEQGNRFNHDPLRTRKLLLHKYEIIKLLGQDSGKRLYPHSPQPVFQEGQSQGDRRPGNREETV